MTTQDELQARIRAKFGAKGSRLGGKGKPRRKRKAARKPATQDDKKLQGQLKKLNVNTIPNIEEVNLFTVKGEVINFQQPKVQASIAANTYVVSGESSVKAINEMMPDILTQLGPESVDEYKSLAQGLGLKPPGVAEAGVDNFEAAAESDEESDDDEDVPELVAADK